MFNFKKVLMQSASESNPLDSYNKDIYKLDTDPLKYKLSLLSSWDDSFPHSPKTPTTSSKPFKTVVSLPILPTNLLILIHL